MDDIGKAIHKAAGILQAAYAVSMRADQFRTGTARGRATAQAMDVLSDELKDLAVKTRADAERKHKAKP
ncbi:MAG: hypothetical protein P8Y36_00105 [Alphaproteobacteria bacterium]